MGMNWNDFKNLAKDQASSTDTGDSGNDAETIYYLQTSNPHEYDLSVSGPYFPLDAIIMQVLHNFGDDCRPGQSQSPSSDHHESNLTSLPKPGRDTFQQNFIRNGHVLDFDRITSP